MQQLNPSEISEIIKSRIDQLDVSSEARNEGTVVSVTDTTVPSLRASELTSSWSMRCLIISLISDGFSCCMLCSSILSLKV